MTDFCAAALGERVSDVRTFSATFISNTLAVIRTRVADIYWWVHGDI